MTYEASYGCAGQYGFFDLWVKADCENQGLRLYRCLPHSGETDVLGIEEVVRCRLIEHL